MLLSSLKEKFKGFLWFPSEFFRWFPVSFMLFNFQGPGFAAFSDSLFILAHLILFVNPFFRLFKSFFMAFLLFGFAMPSVPYSFQELSAPSPECLTIISYHSPIVNYFFRIFSFFRYFLFLYREFYAISLHFPSFFGF